MAFEAFLSPASRDAIGDRRVPETTSSQVKASEIQRISDHIVAKIEEVNLARVEAGEPALYADRASTAREEERSRGDRSAQASRTGRPTRPSTSRRSPTPRRSASRRSGRRWRS